MSRSRVRAALVAGLTGLVTTAATVIALNTAHAEPVRYEAESSTASCDGQIESEHAGYSGSGFCNTENTAGAAVEFTVNAAESGTAAVDIRYANGGSSDRGAEVLVNGSSAGSAAFEPTGAWTDWATESLTLPLSVGANAIRVVASGSEGLPNIDFLEAEVSDGGAEQVRFEAESPSATCDGQIESEHAGYSGSGFCNTENTAGASVEFIIDGAAAGAATLDFGFANGGSDARPADVFVNGAGMGSVEFDSTGAWTDWATERLEVEFSAGTNTVRLVASGSEGLPNIDYLDSSSGVGPDDPTTPDDPSTPPTSGDELFVAPDGSDDAAGTESDPTTLTAAIERVSPGGTIYVRGGMYEFSETVHIEPGNDGLSGDRTELFAYPGETPVLNFSAQSEDSANRGLAIGGDWWHLYGLVVEHAGDNGILLGGDDNIIERVITRFNRDTGLQLSRYTAGAPSSEWPSNNLILSSESHDNADSDGEDADGFAPKLTVGEGNVFRYCVAHNNIDDGWDLYTKGDTGPIGAVVIQDSLSYENGTLSDGSQAGNGDRNGYKLGGEDIGVDHTIERSIAFDNGKHGLTYNRNLGSMTVNDNLSIGNEERNFNFDGGSSTFTGNTSCDSGDEDRIIGNDAGGNQWWDGADGSRCSQYTGPLDWSFDSNGELVVTIGGSVVDL